MGKSAMEASKLGLNQIPEKIIVKGVEDIATTLANRRAARAWSTPGDRLTEEFKEKGGRPFVVARFGGKIAVNGRVLPTREKFNVPEGCVSTDEGGKVPVTEQQISVETIANGVSTKIDVSFERVMDIIDEKFAPELIDNGQFHWTASGSTTVFKCK